jgi:hypothetical protein
MAMKKGFLTAIVAVLGLTGSAFAGGEPDGSMRVWFDGDYLGWAIKNAPVSQPLLTTGTLTNPTAAGSGTLGAPSTRVLFGDNNINEHYFSGFNVNAGWINCADTFGVEGSFFMLPQHANTFTFASDPLGNPVLARPALDVRTGSQTVLFVSAPTAFAGSATVSTMAEFFGGDLNAIWPVERGCCDDDIITYCYLLTGARYLNLTEDLSIGQNTTVLPNGVTFFDGQPVAAGGNLQVSDEFRTRNQFYGGQIGVKGGLTWWRFTLSGTGKFAIGSMREEENISGVTSATTALFHNQSLPAGLLAEGSNSGFFTRSMLAVVPEANLSVSVEITPQIKLTLGYTFLYVSNVARPGENIDLAVNRTTVPSSQAFNPTIPGPARPTFEFKGTDFWAQGINVGLGLRF